MTTQEAAALLKINLPVSPNSLKTIFRRISREEHPDVSKHPEATARFRELKEAYELLQGDPSALEYSAEEAKKLHCDDGTPLSTLGKGLGPTTNGRPCDECSGRGYRSWTSRTISCPDCRSTYGNGVRYRCRKCAGTGGFTVNGVDKGECFACKGEGWHRNKSNINRCVTCKGLEFITDPKGALQHSKCLTCKGTGELMVFNPVLPRGLLAGR